MGKEMNYAEFSKQAYAMAKLHGFHDKEYPLNHCLMLVVTEVAEIVEADRKGRRTRRDMFERESVTPQAENWKEKHWRFCFELFVKDTVEDEMADVCIRLFDLAGLMGWELEEFDLNALPHDFMDKYRSKSCTEIAFEICNSLTQVRDASPFTADIALGCMRCWAAIENIDLDWHIQQKMHYNSMRTRLHGKKY